MGGSDVDDSDPSDVLGAGGADAQLPFSSVCDRCSGLLGGAGVAVALLGPGRRETICASGLAERSIEEWQFTFDDGPCVSAYRGGRPLVGSTGDESPWPSLAPKAAAVGFSWMAGFPLTSGGRAWGALDVYGRTGPLPDERWVARGEAVARATADVVSSLLAGDPSSADFETDRGEVHRATGVVAERFGVPVDEALEIVRARAIVDDRTLLEVARDVLSGDVDLRPR